jgi:hypothetical protein
MSVARLVVLSLAIASGLSPRHADAQLVPSPDGLTVYDAILEVNWLANANFAGTAAGKLGVNNINPDGSMDYPTAVQWLAAVNGLNGGAGYLGHNNWTIPFSPPNDPTCSAVGPNGDSFGFGCMNGAMGSLYYRSLGLHHPDPVVSAPSSAIGPFSNFQPYLYWSGTPGGNASTGAIGHYSFSFNNGFQGSNVDKNYLYVLPMINGKAPGIVYAAGGVGSLQVSADRQTVYDPGADVTWLANANLAKTQLFTAQCVNADGTLCIDPDGAMTFGAAGNWIQGMNAYNGGAGWLGLHGWSLPPTLQPDPSCSLQQMTGYDCTGSPMGELFYRQLGLNQGTPVVPTPGGRVGPFVDFQPYLYWSCEAPNAQSACESSPPVPGFEWSFSFGAGFQGTDLLKNDLYVMIYYPGARPILGVSATVSQATFAPGQTLVVGGAVTDPGLTGAGDFYVGIVRPDGSIQFFTTSGIVFGNLADLSSFRPIATAVALATPFSVAIPNFYSHQWANADSHGAYVFFIAAVKAGALAAGTISNDRILGLATASFSLP